jgi:tRNA pseudouridine55 synthase
VLLLDKPLHLSSNQALQRVKKLYQAQKAGHTGSLDPLATGMLPLCFGEATKFSQFLFNADKTYEVLAQLGASSTTGDSEGELIEQNPLAARQLNKEHLLTVLASFQGESQQIPSMYSALKHQGQPLYKLARQGKEVERQARTIHVYAIELLSQQDDQIRLWVHCSKGTYIRNLVEDIGKELGCGAYVRELRRLTVAHFKQPQMVDLETLQHTPEPARLCEYLLPEYTSVTHLPKISLANPESTYIKQGKTIEPPIELPVNSYVQLFEEDQGFLGVGIITDEHRLKAKRLVKATP